MRTGDWLIVTVLVAIMFVMVLFGMEIVQNQDKILAGHTQTQKLCLSAIAQVEHSLKDTDDNLLIMEEKLLTNDLIGFQESIDMIAEYSKMIVSVNQVLEYIAMGGK